MKRKPNGAKWLTIAIVLAAMRGRDVSRLRREVTADTAGGRAA